ncbi:hypothetical protein QWY85_17045 [Neolewinella lacunae]|uniref:Uncharacterized protein n=1 Tax=Neolewinella lacunae TaxID=1517758 RepID=A0A923PJF3_9BACT|nr:hypothetical protein [Neolewinella lacunae]MBC6993680.1 hypothetical protein [Neolewinella lacunae]MDN3636375.1 hypothetical protein [Neolewinella lacunae]
MIKSVLLGFLTLIISNTTFGQRASRFPAESIDSSIIEKRGLEVQFKMLTEECNWSERIGGKIDVFWLRTEKRDFFGHSYEYFMDCDNVRLIYWYDNPGGVGEPVDFMIEDLEDESQWVVAKGKHLKNKKKYQHLLKNKSDG